MTLEVWVKDDHYFKSVLRDVTQRDGQWRVTCLRDGKRQVSFRGAKSAERAMLFKLAYDEPKGPVTPPLTSLEIERIKEELHAYISAIQDN